MCENFGRIALWLFRSVGFSNWIEILKILGAALAFGIGLNQYRKSEAWKRLEFVAAEMKAFYADPAVKLAMGMLDWRKKEVALYKYRDENNYDRRREFPVLHSSASKLVLRSDCSTRFCCDLI